MSVDAPVEVPITIILAPIRVSLLLLSEICPAIDPVVLS